MLICDDNLLDFVLVMDFSSGVRMTLIKRITVINEEMHKCCSQVENLRKLNLNRREIRLIIWLGDVPNHVFSHSL